MDNLNDLHGSEDLIRLAAVLRWSGASPRRRAAAAQALAAHRDTMVVEMLICASKADPDREVQDAARQALATLLGGDAGLAVKAYTTRSGELDDWLVNAAEEDEVLSILEERQESFMQPVLRRRAAGERIMPGGTFMPADVDYEGLVMLLENDPRIEMRQKAVRLLAYSSDARAVERLLLAALYDEEERVRQTARAVLADLFPGDHEQMLEEYEEEEEAEEAEEEDWNAPNGSVPAGTGLRPLRRVDNTPAIVPEGSGNNLVAGIVIALIVIIIIILLLR